MKKNGFTLPEVLGVIVIIAFLALLITPSVSKSIKNNRKKLYAVQIEAIERAAKDYGIKNSDMLPENGSNMIVTLGQLKQGGFIQEEVRNPITKELFSDDLQIEISRENNQYIYKVLEDMVEE